MEEVAITAENENMIAEKYKYFDSHCWIYDQILLKNNEGTPVIRIFF